MFLLRIKNRLKNSEKRETTKRHLLTICLLTAIMLILCLLALYHPIHSLDTFHPKMGVLRDIVCIFIGGCSLVICVLGGASYRFIEVQELKRKLEKLAHTD